MSQVRLWPRTKQAQRTRTAHEPVASTCFTGNGPNGIMGAAKKIKKTVVPTSGNLQAS